MTRTYVCMYILKSNYHWRSERRIDELSRVYSTIGKHLRSYNELRFLRGGNAENCDKASRLKLKMFNCPYPLFKI